MPHPALLHLLANLVLFLHVAYVLFVLAGFFLILVGGFLRWQWVRNYRFRILHLLAIALVVAESWLGVDCPLTVWEYALRIAAGQPPAAGSFMAGWLQTLFFFDAPAWVFTLGYSAFAALVALSWRLVPPHSHRNSTGDQSGR